MVIAAVGLVEAGRVISGPARSFDVASFDVISFDVVTRGGRAGENSRRSQQAV
jgi:hypothetical protein